MPWPTPASDETEDEFISRCMGNQYIQQDIPTQEERLAVCYRQWENGKQEGTMDIMRKTFTGIELKADKPGAFTARIATLNVVDKDGDVTLPGAFPAGKTILISAYMHGSWSGGLPVGKAVIREEKDDVLIEGEFNLKTDTGKEHYETVKFAPELQEWSYGFIVLALDEESDWNQNPKVWRVFKALDVFEASPVLRGAGVNTVTLAIKNDKHDQGVTFAAQATAALAAVDDLLARAKSLADLRRKEGRDLSPSSREKIAGLRDAISDISSAIGTLLDTPEGKDEEGRKALEALKEFYNELQEVIS